MSETITAEAARPPGAVPPRGREPMVAVLRSNAEVRDYLVAYASGAAATQIGAAFDAAQWSAAQPDDIGGATFARACALGLPLVDLTALQLDEKALALLPPNVARSRQIVPLLLQDGVLVLAASDPADADLAPMLALFTDARIALLVAQGRQVRSAITAHYDRVEDAAIARLLGLDGQRPEDETPDQEVQRLALRQPIVRLIEDILADAAQRRASDVHFRPGASETELLYRIDNELVPVRRFLRTLHPMLVSRVKVLAGMNLAEHRTPQDGRATHIDKSGRRIDLRISVLPTIHGESAAIRLLDTSEGLRSISTLGFSAADELRFLDLLARNHGMVLVTGPTGSGKSTTLYAALLESRKERVNIVTVEDPVEYQIEDVQQMQINRAAGFTFARALRNILRHDPDVIMVGEIRDRETAQIAVESALTGHLILSTLHTNTAATAITRLLDLGVEPFLLRSTLLGVLSQRLARRNCTHCLAVETLPAHWREQLHIGADEEFRHGTGCSRCEGLGVHGRVAVYELMTVSPAIRRLIRAQCEAEAIHDLAIEAGMVPLPQHALHLARAGTISFAEAYRLRID